MTSRRDAAFAAVDDVLRDPAPSPERSLGALAGLPVLRTHLDDLEAAAIDTARRAGASWDDIARALGLRSRQAAEQRRLRLGGPSADLSAVRVTRRRQQKIDNQGGTAISVLRDTSQRLVLRLDDEAAAPAVRLARDTLRMARDAEPGALIDLLRLALDDLGDGVAPDVAVLVDRLRVQLLSITDSSKG